MNRILSKIYFAWVFLCLSLPIRPALAALVTCGEDKPCTYGQILGLIDTLIQFLALKIAMPLATLAILIAGITYVFMPVVPSSKETAKKMLKGAVLGLVATLSAYLIVKLIVTALSGDQTLINLFN